MNLDLLQVDLLASRASLLWLQSGSWSRHKNIPPRHICFDCFPLIFMQFRIARGLKSIFHRFCSWPQVGIWTASHVSMCLVLVSDSFIPKGPWELLWLVQAHRPVFGSVKLAPIKYEKSFVPRHMKSDEGLFWKSSRNPVWNYQQMRYWVHCHCSEWRDQYPCLKATGLWSKHFPTSSTFTISENLWKPWPEFG